MAAMTSDTKANIAYGHNKLAIHIEKSGTAIDSEEDIYELPDLPPQPYTLPKMLPPEPKECTSWSPGGVKDKKNKWGCYFNIFITVLAVSALLLALIILIVFLGVQHSSNQPTEMQQSIDIEALKSQLNKSNEDVLIEVLKLEKAQLLIHADYPGTAKHL